MGAVFVVLILVALLVPAAMVFWAMFKTESLTKRLHPLTPEQRRRRRKAFAVASPLMVVLFGLGAAIGSGGTVAVVALAVLAAIVLLDATLTPWLRYRHARRKAAR